MASRAAQLKKLVERFQPVIRDAFLEAIADITDRAILGEIIAAIEAGDIERAVRSLGLTASAFRPLMAAIEQAFETGGIVTGASFPNVLNTPGGRTVFRFDVRNSRAEAWLRDLSSQYVTSITEETRGTVRRTIQQGMVDGRNPRSTALDLVGRIDRQTGRRVGGSIGLTPGQERWVTNTRRELARINDMIRDGTPLEVIKRNPYFSRALRGQGFDELIFDAVRKRQPLSGETVEKLVTQYKSNALRYRGEVIGRTESISALNRSEHEAINQAVDMGAVKESAVKRVWDSAGDDGRTRESHLKMDTQTVGLNEPFTFPDGSKAMFPGDTSLDAPAEETIQCRCIARTVIDWLAGARDVTTPEERAAILALSDDELFGGRSVT